LRKSFREIRVRICVILMTQGKVGKDDYMNPF
jgi:hypothetical protein